MKLSVIIPVYNAGPWLARCLDTLPQTDGVEYIVVDDGSTDDTGVILERYKDRFKIAYHASNWGVSLTRNHGFSIAGGDYVTFLDADDEYHPSAIAVMLAAIEKASAPVLMFDHLRVYGNEPPILRFNNAAGRYGIDKMPQKWQTVWTKVYDRSFLIENEISFKQGLDYGEDEIFNLECLRACGAFYCTGTVTVIKHFDNPSSLCHTLNKERLVGLTRAIEDMIVKDNAPEFDALLRRRMAEIWGGKTYKGVFGE